MKKYAVAGFPISHSMSRLIFRHFFRQKNINADYAKISCDNAAEFIGLSRQIQLSGANITTPLKKQILPFSSNLNDKEKLKSANTIRFSEKELFCANTDIFGIEKSLEQFEDEIIGGKSAILGTGPAAESACIALNNLRSSPQFVSRNPEKGQLSYADFIREIEKFNVIINASGTNPFNRNPFRKAQIILDANYKDKPLKNFARIAEAKYISGENWLLAQAASSFKYFFEDREIPDYSKIELKTIRKPKHIILIGYSGSGKSSVGKILAEKLNWKFIDIDKLIIKKHGNISKIFALFGEDTFREFELKELVLALNEKNAVISTGGGILTNSISKKLINWEFAVWLHCPVKICYERIRTELNDRPLAQLGFHEFEKIYEKRLNDYFQSSTIIVNSNKSVNSITRQIHLEIENIGHG